MPSYWAPRSRGSGKKLVSAGSMAGQRSAARQIASHPAASGCSMGSRGWACSAPEAGVPGRLQVRKRSAESAARAEWSRQTHESASRLRSLQGLVVLGVVPPGPAGHEVRVGHAGVNWPCAARSLARIPALQALQEGLQRQPLALWRLAQLGATTGPGAPSREEDAQAQHPARHQPPSNLTARPATSSKSSSGKGRGTPGDQASNPSGGAPQSKSAPW